MYRPGLFINRNWPFPIGETNRVSSILHYENYKCDWLCLVSSDTWSNILHSGRKGTKRFGICSDFLKKNRNIFLLYIFLSYTYTLFPWLQSTREHPPNHPVEVQSVKRVQLSVICLFRMRHTRTTFVIDPLRGARYAR